MKRILFKFAPLIDVLLVPFVYPVALLMKGLRRLGLHHLPTSKAVLISVGVFPLRNHYYEPRFDYRDAPHLTDPRDLPGIAWNDAGQLEMLDGLTFAEELRDVGQEAGRELTFYLNNGAFESGDAEYWYQLIRFIKPRRLFEIGSGHSTLMAMRAIQRNREQDATYDCRHVCVEPFEMPWLERIGVTVVRHKVEDLGRQFFAELDANDILFIDSSHMIRPRGDVLFEYLELLPSLRRGVFVHVHDIFSPYDYPEKWLKHETKFWNEQYLLEAFLSHNSSWEIVGAINYLHHYFPERLRAVAPFLTRDREPGSFYIKKIV